MRDRVYIVCLHPGIRADFPFHSTFGCEHNSGEYFLDFQVHSQILYRCCIKIKYLGGVTSTVRAHLSMKSEELNYFLTEINN
jgi:hypothetical protein